MNIRTRIFLVPLMIALSLVTIGCGKKSSKKVETAGTTTSTEPTVPGGGSVSNNPLAPDAGGSLLSFDINNMLGGDASFTTPAIPTDNVLRVGFVVGTVGNNVFADADLRVEITVNGTTMRPQYNGSGCPEEGCEYGRPTDGMSIPLNFNSAVQALSPGVPVTIKVTNAYYDWYCHIYGFSAGCRKKVLNPSSNPYIIGHEWNGRLIVQTSSSVAIEQYNGN